MRAKAQRHGWRLHKWTIPTSYPNQDFDEIQIRALEITDDLREQGKYSGSGYTKEAWEQARTERQAAEKNYYANTGANED